MQLTDQQRAEFDKMALELMQWLDKNCHPHVTVVIDSRSAEALEGFACAVFTKGE